MKTQIELRESALIVAEKITPFKNFDEVVKTADKVLAYITKDGELKDSSAISDMIELVMPLVYAAVNGTNDANDKPAETEAQVKDETVEAEVKEPVQEVEPIATIKKK